MHLPRTEEQCLLEQSVLRYLESNPAATATVIARMGWSAAAFGEEDGGLGGRAADIVPVCEAIGAAGAGLPYYSLVLLPAMLIRHVPDARHRAALADACMGGAHGIAVAHQERGQTFDARAAVEARVDGSGALSGAKQRVWNAAPGCVLLVSAQGPRGFGIYRVDADAPGVAIEACHDDRAIPWARVTFVKAAAAPLMVGATARTALEAAADFALVGVLAETLGLMASAFEATRAWLATRTQFGKPLAANQVLQHRLVDMFIAIEESRSMLNLAVHAFDHGSAGDRVEALSAARVHIAKSARMVGQSAVHLHGAMGVTEELAAARAYRRIEQLGALFGGADHHLARYLDGVEKRA